MNIVRFLAPAILLILVTSPGLAQAPNFLIIIADDVTYNDLPLYGGQNIKTPNIDRLASEGVTFNRAYLSMSMCNPCRTELYTGLYPYRSGSAWNHSSARPGTRSVVHYLRELGYRVGLSGKKHVQPADSFDFETVKGVPNPIEPTPDPEFDTMDIQKFMSRDSDQPFLLVTGFHEAHTPWTAGHPERFDLDKLILPDNIADTPRTRELFAAYLAEIVVWDWEVGKLLDALEASGQAENTVVLLTSEQGSAFPGNKWTNWNSGVRTALVVRWPGTIEAGKRTDALVQYADVLPTLLSAAGATALNQFDGRSFLQVLVGAASSHREYVYFMHQNVPAGPPYPIRGIADRDWHYVRNLAPDRIYIQKHMMGLYSGRWFWETWIASTGPAADQRLNQKALDLLTRFVRRPPEQLYRASGDPFHLRNLIGDVGLSPVRNRMAAELGRWMQSQGDPGAGLDTEDQWLAARKGEHLRDVPSQ